VNDAPVRRRPDVLWRRSLDAIVLLPPASEEPVTLAGTGPAVWELLAEWRTEADLVAVLAAAFEVPAERVTADLSSLLTELRALGVVETAADSGGAGAE
jgi:hypothetical protein